MGFVRLIGINLCLILGLTGNLFFVLGNPECVHHHIELNIQPSGHFISGSDTLSLAGNPSESLYILINKNFFVTYVQVDHHTVTWEESQDFSVFYGHLEPWILNSTRRNAKVLAIQAPATVGDRWQLEIRYWGQMPQQQGFPGGLRDAAFEGTAGAIGNSGVYLPADAFWYPRLGGETPPMSISVEGPENFYFIARGNKKTEEIRDGHRHVTWETEHGGDAAHLVGGQFVLHQTQWRRVNIYTYLLPEDEILSSSAIDIAKKCLTLYTEMIGPYPLEKFAIVENPLSPVYGLTSFAVLSQGTLRQSVLLEMRLGHELLRSWWGNCVQVETTGGNWSEGLLTYLADHYLRELKSPEDAARFRKECLSDYAANVKSDAGAALKNFVNIHNPETQAIGRSKSAMVFHMLRKFVGDEVFFEALVEMYQKKQWKKASWRDIQISFEKIYKESHEEKLKAMKKRGRRIPQYERDKDLSLEWFFQQWITRAGAPNLQVKVKNLFHPMENQHLLAFIISQSASDYRLYIPIFLETGKSTEKRWVTLDRPSQEFQVFLSEEPKVLKVDSNFDVFRNIWTRDIQPTFAEILQSKNLDVVLPSMYGKSSVVKSFVNDRLPGLSKQILETGSMPDPSHSCLIILEPWQLKDHQWRNVLKGKVELRSTSLNLENIPILYSGHTIFLAVQARNQSFMLVISDGMAEELRRTLNECLRMGGYNYLVFKDGKNVLKGRWKEPDSPLSIPIK